MRLRNLGRSLCLLLALVFQLACHSDFADQTPISDEPQTEPPNFFDLFFDQTHLGGATPEFVHEGCLPELDAIMEEICERFDLRPLAKFGEQEAIRIDICGERLLQNYVTAFQAEDYPRAVRLLQRLTEYLRVVDQSAVRAVEFALAGQIKALISQPGLADEKSSCMRAIINPAILVADRLLYTKISMVQRLIQFNSEEIFEALVSYPIWEMGLHCYDERVGKLAQVGSSMRISEGGFPIFESPLTGMVDALANPWRLGSGACSCLELSLNGFICNIGILCPSDVDWLSNDSFAGLGFNGSGLMFDGSLPTDDTHPFETGFVAHADPLSPLGGGSLDWIGIGGNDIQGMICSSGQQGGREGGGFPQIGSCELASIPSIVGSEEPTPVDRIIECHRRYPERPTDPNVGGFDDGSLQPIGDPLCAVSEPGGGLGGGGSIQATRRCHSSTGPFSPTDECDAIGNTNGEVADRLNDPNERDWLLSQCTVHGNVVCGDALGQAILDGLTAANQYNIWVSDFLTAITGALGYTTDFLSVLVDAGILSDAELRFEVIYHEVLHVILRRLGIPFNGGANLPGGQHSLIYGHLMNYFCSANNRGQWGGACDRATAGFCLSVPTSDTCQAARTACQSFPEVSTCNRLLGQCRANFEWDNTETGCPDQIDCLLSPDRQGCPQQCIQNPNLSGCPNADECRQNPNQPGCPNSDQCRESPNDSRCPTPEDCRERPTDARCPTSGQCQDNPDDPRCPNCQQDPCDSRCPVNCEQCSDDSRCSPPEDDGSDMPTPEGDDPCSAEAERFRAIFQCIFGDELDQGPVTPPRAEPECPLPVDGVCEPADAGLPCLGDGQHFPIEVGQLGTLVDPRLIQCPDDRPDCLQMSDPQLSQTPSLNPGFIDCQEGDELCPDGHTCVEIGQPCPD